MTPVRKGCYRPSGSKSKGKTPQEAVGAVATKKAEAADRQGSGIMGNTNLRACRQDSGEGSPKGGKQEAQREAARGRSATFVVCRGT